MDDLLSSPGFPEELLWFLSRREFSFMNEKMGGFRRVMSSSPLLSITTQRTTNH